MKAYVVVNARVVDPELLERYRAGARHTIGKHGGTVLAGSNDATVLEGEPAGTRVVLIEFPSREAAMAWYDDPEYAGPKAERLQATAGVALLVDGRS